MNTTPKLFGKDFWLRVIILLLVCLATLGRAPAASQAEEKEQSLRKRVEEFYALWQVGKMSEAEKYVAPNSKQVFESFRPSGFVGYEVKSIELKPDEESATVRLNTYNYMPISAKPLPFAQVTEWRLIDGIWFVEFPKPDIGSAEKSTSSASGAGTPSPAEQLKFKGHRFGLGDIYAGQIKTARFPFTNVADHTVTITSVEVVSPALKLKTEKKVYKSGESGELVIEFNPGNLEGDFAQTIFVKTDPGKIETRLLVTGFVAFRRVRDEKNPGRGMPWKYEPLPEKPHN